MKNLSERLALSDRLLGLAVDAPNNLTRDALQEASKYLLSGVPIPLDIAGIVESALSFNQNRFGK